MSKKKLPNNHQEHIRIIVQSRVDKYKLSHRATAREIGITESSFSRFMNGKNLDIDLLYPVAKWCNLTISQALNPQTLVKNDKPIIHSIIEIIQQDQLIPDSKKLEFATWFQNTYKTFVRCQ